MKNISENKKEGAFFFLCGLALFAYSVISHKNAGIEFILSPYLFPSLIGIFLLVFSFLLMREKDEGENKLKAGKDILFFVLLTVLYYVILPFAGFILSTLVFLVSAFYLLGERRKKIIIIYSLLVPFTLYFIFGKLLHVMLP